MRPVIRGGASAYQINYKFLCQVLRDGVQSEPGAKDGIDSILHRAGATLYSLLVDHPVDRQGRCQSCRRPSAMLGLRRRHCQVRNKADMWLRLPAELFQSFLASELGLSPTVTPLLSARGTADPPTQPLQTPAVPPHLPPQVPPGGTAGPKSRRDRG